MNIIDFRASLERRLLIRSLERRLLIRSILFGKASVSVDTYC